MQKSGTVEVLQEKTEAKSGKRLRSPLYSVKLDDGQWYNFGFNRPRCAKGDAISFQASQGEYGWEGDADTVTVAAAGSPAAKAVVQTGDARQTSIVYQSQHRDALAAVQFAIQADLVKLPAKQADKYDVFLELIKDLTVTWTKDALQPDLSEPEDVPFEVDEDE